MDRISILVPTYKRNKFLPLLLRNVMIQDYPKELLTLLIQDDSPNGEELIKPEDIKKVKEHLHPVKLDYKRYHTKKTIGEKRNSLVKSAKDKIVVFLDDDDIYMPTYISYSYNMLKGNKVGCVGSNQMLFCMSQKNYEVYGINCGNNISLIHEATIMMTKKWFNSTCKFARNSQGEGKNLFNGAEKNVFNTDIAKVMICLAHDGNTIDKMRFAEDDNKMDITMNESLITILEKILKS